MCPNLGGQSETLKIKFSTSFSFVSLYLTYEGLKLLLPARFLLHRIVCILPMRDWNWTHGFSFVSKHKVCILPMRDRNLKLGGQLVVDLASLYLTYEGLKPCKGKWNFETKQVCILPMRDWNPSIVICVTANVFTFVSYLWGIETWNWADY